MTVQTKSETTRKKFSYVSLEDLTRLGIDSPREYDVGFFKAVAEELPAGYLSPEMLFSIAHRVANTYLYDGSVDTKFPLVVSTLFSKNFFEEYRRGYTSVRYTPNYDDQAIRKAKSALMSGRVQDQFGDNEYNHLVIEETAQRLAAESVPWLLAQSLGYSKVEEQDSRGLLESMGFKILSEVSRIHFLYPKWQNWCHNVASTSNSVFANFYQVIHPSGFTKTTRGYHTDVMDGNGVCRLHQFFKGSGFDPKAVLSVPNQ